MELGRCNPTQGPTGLKIWRTKAVCTVVLQIAVSDSLGDAGLCEYASKRA